MSEVERLARFLALLPTEGQIPNIENVKKKLYNFVTNPHGLVGKLILEYYTECPATKINFTYDPLKQMKWLSKYSLDNDITYFTKRARRFRNNLIHNLSCGNFTLREFSLGLITLHKKEPERKSILLVLDKLLKLFALIIDDTNTVQEEAIKVTVPSIKDVVQEAKRVTRLVPDAQASPYALHTLGWLIKNNYTHLFANNKFFLFGEGLEKSVVKIESWSESSVIITTQEQEKVTLSLEREVRVVGLQENDQFQPLSWYREQGFMQRMKGAKCLTKKGEIIIIRSWVGTVIKAFTEDGALKKVPSRTLVSPLDLGGMPMYI